MQVGDEEALMQARGLWSCKIGRRLRHRVEILVDVVSAEGEGVPQRDHEHE
jgi:hypothetical protein